MRRAALAVLGFFGLACGETEVVVEPRAPSVTVAPVQARDLIDRIEATGQLLAKADATLAAEVAGRVTEVRVEEGDPVEAGAALLEIDPQRRELELRNARAGAEEARANLKERQRELARAEALGARGAASQARIEAASTEVAMARSRVRAAEARLGLAQRSLEDASIQAPFSGVVSRRYVSAGEFVAAGQKLFDLVALDPVEVEFHLPEVDSARVSVGDRVEVRVAPYPEEVFAAHVTVVAPTIDPTTRTLRVKGEIDNADGRLRPGLFARADLGVATRPGVPMIPQQAVLQRADGAVVFVLDGADQVTRVNVRTGTYDGGDVEVRKGLEPGMQVVVRGHAELIDGSRVSVRNPDGTLAAVGSRGEGAAAP